MTDTKVKNKLLVIYLYRDKSEGVTPVPISNTEVKPFSADGTWRETAWESRSLRYEQNPPYILYGGFFGFCKKVTETQENLITYIDDMTIY